MGLKFNSGFKVEWELEKLTVEARSLITDELIKNEPMVFSSDLDFTKRAGGLLTHVFLSLLPERFKADPNLIIDSRVHMLMPGWFPCIPGWHLDDIPRTRPDGQPDHVNPAYRAEHAMMIIGDASKTAFAVGELELEDLPVGGGVIYGEWHKDLEGLLAAGKLKLVEAESGQLITFDDQSFHRGAAATKNGWRFFIRASRATQRVPANEIRRQVQAYLPAVNGGW